MSQKYPSVDYVKSLFRYKDGKLFWQERPRKHFPTYMSWKTWNGRFSGKEAGGPHYYPERDAIRWTIKIDKQGIRRHAIVWAIHNGYWAKEIDHKNRDPSDDRIENLRECTNSQNNANQRRRSDNKSGFKGAYWCNRGKRWCAMISFNGKNKYLGGFDTPEEAHLAYVKAARELFGEFACEG